MKPKVESSVTIRTFRKSDLAELTRIGMRAFTGPGTEERWELYLTKNPYLPAERQLVAEVDGKIVGETAMLDFRTTIEGRLCAADGIAAVAVDTTARRQGVADALMREAVTSAHRRRYAVSMLYPFRASFYRRFGYAPVETAQVIHAHPSLLPDSAERKHVRAYCKEDLDGMKRCYDRTLPGSTGLLKRNDFWWTWRVFNKNQERVVFQPDGRGRIEGYAICEMVEYEHIGDRRFRVLELVANTVRARRGLLGWLASTSDEIGTIEIFTSHDRSLVPFLRDPSRDDRRPELRHLTQTGYLGWGAMARITHMEKALAFRRGRGVKGTLTVELTDSHLEANREPVTVMFTGKGAKIVRGKRSRNRVRADIGVFSQVWMGAVSATHAREMDELDCSADTASLLDRAWFGPAPYFGPLNGF
jgi:predicted acetyltransferase